MLFCYTAIIKLPYIPIKNSKMSDLTSHLTNATAIIKLPYIPIKNSKMNDFTSHLFKWYCYNQTPLYTNQE